MAYKSRKRLCRKKAAFGVDGAIIAAATMQAAAMQTAATIQSAKEQATATKLSAMQQAQATQQSGQINANSIKEQSELSKENVEKQIQTQKDTIESQNDILKEMNMNLALQAGQQNEQERKKESKIVVKYGGKLSKRKRLANGGITPGSVDVVSGLTMQDSGFSIPIGDGLSLLQGGSPSQPRQQTHSNSHVNPLTGKQNTGIYFKTPQGKEIEAEAGILGTDKPGEIYDRENNMIYSQRHFLRDGSSPVEKILAGVPKEQVAVEQEVTKAQKGLGDYDKAKCGKRLRYGGRVKARNGLLDKPVLYFQNPVTNDTVLVGNNATTIPSSSNGSFWSSPTGDALISGGINLAAAGLNWLGNSIAAKYQREANEYANGLLTDARNQSRDVMIDAYNQMHGIDLDKFYNDGNWKAAHALASIRSGRYNINPQLAQIERDALRQQSQINRSTNSAAARNSLLNRVLSDANDRRSKWYAEQANRVEAINQGNIQELNKIANENANRDTQMLTQRNNSLLSAMQYNNDIENAKIQGIAQSKTDAILGNAQSTGQIQMNNASIRGQAFSNGLAGMANVLPGVANTYLTDRRIRDDHYNNVSIALASSTNPNGMINMMLTNPKSYSNNNLIQAYNSTDNNTQRDRLRELLKQRGITV